MDPLTITTIAALSGGKLAGGILEGIGQKKQWQWQNTMARNQGVVQAAGARVQEAQGFLQGAQATTVGMTRVANMQAALGRDIGAMRAQAAKLGIIGGSSSDVIRDIMQTAARQQEDVLLNAIRERNAFETQARMSRIQGDYTLASSRYAAGPKPNMFMSVLEGMLDAGSTAFMLAGAGG